MKRIIFLFFDLLINMILTKRNTKDKHEEKFQSIYLKSTYIYNNCPLFSLLYEYLLIEKMKPIIKENRMNNKIIRNKTSLGRMIQYKSFLYTF
jgi:hypothetical protein